MASTHFCLSCHVKVAKAIKLCYMFSSSFKVFQVSTKSPKRNYNITFKGI